MSSQRIAGNETLRPIRSKRGKPLAQSASASSEKPVHTPHSAASPPV